MPREYEKMPGASEFSAYSNDITIRLGITKVMGRFVSVKKPESQTADGKTKTKLCSPDGKKVEQFYKDDEGHTFKVGELKKAEVTKDPDTKAETYKIVADSASAKKKSEKPNGVLNFTIHNASDVEGVLFPVGSGLVFEVNTKDPDNVDDYKTLVTALSDDTKAFMCIANVKNAEGMYRLTTWRGHIVAQQVMYPEDFNEFAEANDCLTGAAAKKIHAIIDTQVEPFVFEDYKNVIARQPYVLTGEDAEIPEVSSDDEYARIMAKLERMEKSLKVSVSE